MAQHLPDLRHAAEAGDAGHAPGQLSSIGQEGRRSEFAMAAIVNQLHEQAAKIAEHQADIQWSLGYDFGYCSPGTIDWVEPEHSCGGENGRWEVCFP
jgi:hypothetical protein